MPPKQDLVRQENKKVGREILVKDGDHVTCLQCGTGPFLLRNLKRHIAPSSDHQKCIELGLSVKELRTKLEIDCVSIENARIGRKVLVQNGDIVICEQCADDPFHIKSVVAHIQGQMHKHCVEHQITALEYRSRSEQANACGRCDICNAEASTRHLNGEPHKVRARLLAYHENMEGREILRCAGEAPIFCHICNVHVSCTLSALETHIGSPDHVDRLNRQKCLKPAINTRRTGQVDTELEWRIAQAMWDGAQDALAEQCPRSAVCKFLRMSPEYPDSQSLEPSGPEVKKMCQDQFNAHFTELLPRVCGVCGVLEASREPLAHISLNETCVLKCGETHMSREAPEVRNRHMAEISGTFYSVDPSALCRHNEIPACPNCFESVRGGKVPPLSFRNGWDFGRPINELGLCPLRLVELSAICRVLHFTTLCEVRHTQKFDANFSRHNISFLSKGPQHLAQALPVCEQRVFVTFVGEKTKQKALQCQEFRQKFEVRVDVVVQWLQFLKRHNTFYDDVAISESNLNELRAMGVTILSNASTANQPTSVGASLLAHAKNPTSGENPPEENVLLFTEELEGDVSLALAQNLQQILKLAERDPHPAPGEQDSEIDDEDVDPHGPKDETDGESDHRNSESETDDNDVSGLDPYTGDSVPTYGPNKNKVEGPSHTVPITVTSNAINEFTENDVLLGGGMPHLFPVLSRESAQHLRRPLTTKFLRHLLLQRDSRWAADGNFNFIHFSQIRRHSLSRSVRARPKMWSKVQALFRTPNLESKLYEASRTPKTSQHRALLRKVSSVVQNVTRHVPFSDASRNSCFSEMVAMHAFMGYPTLYITVSPCDADMRLTLHYLSTSTSPKQYEQLVQELGVRVQAVRDHPAYAAHCFHILLSSIIEHLFGVTLESQLKKSTSSDTEASGLFGRIKGLYGVVETQGRGSLHHHMLIWGLPPADFVSENIHDSNIRERICRLVSDWSTVSVPWDDRVDKPMSFRSGLEDCPSFDNDGALRRREYLVASTVQQHAHYEGCFKNKHFQPVKCRYAYPRSETDADNFWLVGREELKNGSQTYSLTAITNDNVMPFSPQGSTGALGFGYRGVDCRPIVYLPKRHRNDVNTAEYNRLLTSLVGCNTNVVFLGSSCAAAMAMFYLFKYLSKNLLSIASCSGAVHAAKEKEKYQGKGTHANATETLMCNRLGNSQLGLQEVSPQLAAYCCMGYNAEEKTHATTYLDVNSAIMMLVHGNVVHEAQDDDPDDCDDFTLAVGVGEDGNPEMRSIAIDYYYRGKELSFMSLYLYTATVAKVKQSCAPTNGCSGPQGAGRKRNTTFAFHSDHPESSTFTQRLKSKYTIPSPGHVPRWSHHRETSQEFVTETMTRLADRHARYFTALHRPFSCECKVPYDRESWKQYLAILRSRAQSEQVLGTDLPPAVCATLVKIINNLRIGINDDAFEEPRNMMNTMRYKCASEYTAWQQSNSQSMAKDVSDATGCDEQVAIDAVNDLLAAQQSHTTNVRRDKKGVSPEVAEYLSALEQEVRIFTRLSENGEKLSTPSECALGQGSSVAHNAFSVYIRQKGQKRFMNLSSTANRNSIINVNMNDVDPTDVAHRANQNTYSAVPTVLFNDETARHIDNALLLARNELQLRPSAKQLDREQAEFVLRCVEETEMRRRSPLSGRGYLAFLHGGPGTGKSETVKCFMSIKRLIRSSSILAFGYSGACAVGVNGTTIHSGFAFPARSRGHTAFDKHLKSERLLALQQRFRDVDTIVLDEASCISTHMLWCIHQRLCMAKGTDSLFGGVSVIMVGDFFQLPPLKTAGTSLIYGASCGATSRTMSINDFDFTDLTVQHRAAGTSDDDVAHQQMLKDLRDPKSCKGAFEAFLKRAQYTSRMSTPQQCCMLVATNKEREVVSKLQCECYAQRLSLPVAKVQLDKVEYYSVPGKPLMCLRNLSLENKLVNGTLMKEVGLVMSTLTARNDFLAYVRKNGKPGEVLDCTHFPVYAIRAQTLGVTPTVTCDFRTAEEDGLEISCGFAYTVHKVQGATLDTDVCVNLLQRPKSYHAKMMTHAAVYVALSRVKRASLLWVLGKKGNKALEYLLDMRPNPDVVAFVAGMKQKCHGTAFIPPKKEGILRTHGKKRPRAHATDQGSNSTTAACGTPARSRTECHDDPVKSQVPLPGKRKVQTLTAFFTKRTNSQAPEAVPKERCSEAVPPEHANEVNVDGYVSHVMASAGERIGNNWTQCGSLIPERVIDSVGSLLSMRCREFKVLQVNTLTSWARTNDVFPQRLESVSLRRIFHTADTIAIPICEQNHYILYVVRLQLNRDGTTTNALIRWFDSLPDYCPAARSDHVKRIHQLLRSHIGNIAELDESSTTQGSTETQEVNSNDCGLFLCRWLIREAQCCPNRQFLYKDLNPDMTRGQLALWLGNTSEAYPGHDSDVPALILLAGQTAVQGGANDILASLAPCSLVDSAVVYRALLQHQDPRCKFRVHHPLAPQAVGTFKEIMQGANVPHDLSCDHTHIWPLFFDSHCILCVCSKQRSVIQVYDSLPTYYSQIRDCHVSNLRVFLSEHWASDVAVELMTCPVQIPGSNDCAIHTINNGLRSMGVAIEHTRASLYHQWKTLIDWIEKFGSR